MQNLDQNPTLDGPLRSVGTLAREIGLSPEVLRAWERRYGEPRPVRLPSGHRRYTEAQARRLRRVAEGLSMGHRPGVLLKSSDDELDAILLAGAPVPDQAARERWIEAVRSMDEDQVRAELERDAEDLPQHVFLEQRVVPFLVTLGRAWSEDRIDVTQEHFASRVVEAILDERRQAVRRSNLASAGSVVLAGLRGEEHALPLHMIALVAETAGLTPILLGPNRPVNEIVSTVIERRADAVAISVSLANTGPTTDRRLRELRDSMPDGMELVVGGAGIRPWRPKPAGIRHFRDLGSFRTWLAQFAHECAGRRGATPQRVSLGVGA